MRIVMPLITLSLIIASIVLSTITKKKDYSKKKRIIFLLISTGASLRAGSRRDDEAEHGIAEPTSA